MLTEKHLAIIRAALRFWDQEMSPHGDDMFLDYLDESDRNLELTVADTRVTRELLSQSSLFYALAEKETNRLLSGDLIDATVGDEITFHSDRARLVTVLVPKLGAK